MSDVKIVFFGSSEFAVKSLQMLSQTHFRPIAVVTPIAKPKGRSLRVSVVPVEKFARENGLRRLPMENVNSQHSIEIIKDLEPDICVVVAFGQIFREEILAIPKVAFLNAHASLLPFFRGPAPIQHAILNGNTTTGITVQKVVPEVDSGDILVQKTTFIGTDEDAISLTERLSQIAGECLIDGLNMILSGNAIYRKQDASNATYAPKIKISDGLIQWGLDATGIYNRIRAFVPFPCAWTYFRGKILKIWKATIVSTEKFFLKPGTISDIKKNGLVVMCGRGSILVKEVQMESKRRICATDFANGVRLSKEEVLG
jgi:methionyl-tRNA formyltransferase